jgi:hypothetical protein
VVCNRPPEMDCRCPWYLTQTTNVVLLVHEFAWRRDCRSTPAGARTRLTSVRLLRRLRGHGKPCQVLSELPVRKLSYQGR